MILKSLKLKNIGPFKVATIDFPTEKVNDLYPVTIITGENGTGKSIIIDAIRNLLGGPHVTNVRNIISDEKDFYLQLTVDKGIEGSKYEVSELQNGKYQYKPIANQLYRYMAGIDEFKEMWVFDYWGPNRNSGDYKLDSIKAINTKNALIGSLLEDFPNIGLSKFITSIEYLKSSESEKEREIGTTVYNIISDIIADCLDEGYKLEYVSHLTMSPIIKVNGRELTLDKLSLGNTLMISHFIRLLTRMYATIVQSGRPIKEIKEVSGVLLIDEIESHLHPKWQKRIVSLIQKHFNNIQIILTTHSPFIVSSISNPHVFVCQSQVDHSTLENVSDDYSNLPVDEVLTKPVFAVGPFSEEITKLLAERKRLISMKDYDAVKNIESRLVEINDSSFGYFSSNFN